MRQRSGPCATPTRSPRRPASARGFLGQPVLSLEVPSLLRLPPARRRSAALPVHEPRSAMISRTRVGPSIGRVGAREIDPLGCERSVSN